MGYAGALQNAMSGLAWERTRYPCPMVTTMGLGV